MKIDKTKEADRNRNFSKYGLKVETGADAKEEQMCVCPECSQFRSVRNRKVKCCSVNVDYGVWHCHHCNASGYVPSVKELEARTARQKRIDAKRDSMPPDGKFSRPKEQPGFTIDYILISPRASFKKQIEEGNEPSDDELIALVAHEEQRKVLNYLVHDRKLTLDTLCRAPVGMPWWKDSEDKEEVVMRFYYRDHRTLINQKTRTMGKKFWMHRDAEVIPYNIDAIMRKPVCYITEGEFDAISLMQAGFPEAISVPAGGSNTNLEWLDRFAETLFDDKETIFLCTDNDKVGYNMMKELVRRLGGYRCKIVLWDEGCKDANEELQAHGEEGIRRCIERAQPVPDYGVETAKTPHVERELDDLFLNGMGTGAPIGIDNVDRLITYETGRFMLVTGRPGDGKSEFLDEICLRLALRQGWKTAYFSPENFPLKYHLAKLISKLTGFKFAAGGSITTEMYERCKEWLARNMCHIMPGGEDEEHIADFGEKVDIRQLLSADIANSETFTLNQVLAVAREAVVRRGVRILVLDPLNSIMRDDEDKGLSDLDWDLQVCNKLLAFAHTNDVLVILVAHPRKVDRATMTNAKRRVEMNDINGSSKFGAKCDYCLIIDRDDDLKVVNAYVDKVKFKHLGTRGSTTLFYDIPSGRYVPCEVRRLTPNEQRMIEQNGAPKGVEIIDKDNAKWMKTVDWRWFNVRWI
ncbi:MAG: toprim domain-containing protein [Prevotellaceae bacterium]|nr:toprim domain-containing protein [Candidatus Minthosoma equi]